MAKAVLHILGSAEVEGTGISRIVSALARGLDPSKYRVHVWFLGPPGPLMEEIRASGAIVRGTHWTEGVRDPVGALRFWRDLRAQDFAIVHLHTFDGRSIRCVIRQGSRAPILKHVHGEILKSEYGDNVRALARHADAVVVVSQAIARQIPDVDTFVVHAGVAPSSEPEATPQQLSANIVVGTACRLVPAKGVQDLIQAVAMLSPDIPQLRLEIAGRGPYQTELMNEARRLGIDKTIRFLGWQQQLGPCFRNWDIFVLPSHDEGFGMAVLEAMAGGLPVIGTGVGGLPELIEEGRTGFIVLPSNPVDLAERLRLLVLDPKLRQAMGNAGQERARMCFSVDRMVADFTRIYDKLCERQ